MDAKKLTTAVGMLLVLLSARGIWAAEGGRAGASREQTFQEAGLQGIAIRSPSSDPGARAYDTCYVYVNREIVLERKAELPKDRGELLVFLPGTGGHGQGAKAFCRLAANLGYRVVSLAYPNDLPATVCGNDPNPEAFERFRMAIIEGGSVTIAGLEGRRREFSVAKADSIEMRLCALLEELVRLRPRENWAQFLTQDKRVNWSVIAFAGQSQGGGHAALIGIKHRVARVICTGAPKDYSKRLNGPAAWYGKASATPKGCFFTFNHVQDPKGCAPEGQLQNIRMLGLDAFGRPIDVTKEPAPFQHSRTLLTSFPEVTVEGVESDGAKAAHTSVIDDRNADRWKDVWTYMLTERVP